MNHCLFASFLEFAVCTPLQAISLVDDSLASDSTEMLLHEAVDFHNKGAFLLETFSALTMLFIALLLAGIGYVVFRRNKSRISVLEKEKEEDATENMSMGPMKTSSRIIIASGAILTAVLALWKSGFLNRLLGRKLMDLQDVTDLTVSPEPATEPKDGETHAVESDRQRAIEPTKKVAELHGVDPKGKSFTTEQGDWFVVGASVQGNGHLDGEVPCQDSHAYEYISDEWGIAVTSDGAGSAKYSHVGSAVTASRALYHFKELIQVHKWIEDKTLPEDHEWTSLAYNTLRKVYEDLRAFAGKNDFEIKDLSATIIVVIHTPYGLLMCHVGDGRAGYRDTEGKWHTLLIPHKGEEANQTIFLPSNFWETPFYTMSGVFVPEARVIRDKVSAFTLMSDGCENTAWLCHTLNTETNKYYDRNLPYDKFFEPVIQTLRSIQDDEQAKTECAETWYNFIKDGNPSFVKETDDKTIVLAILKNKR